MVCFACLIALSGLCFDLHNFAVRWYWVLIRRGFQLKINLLEENYRCHRCIAKSKKLTSADASEGSETPYQETEFGPKCGERCRDLEKIKTGYTKYLENPVDIFILNPARCPSGNRYGIECCCVDSSLSARLVSTWGANLIMTPAVMTAVRLQAFKHLIHHSLLGKWHIGRDHTLGNIRACTWPSKIVKF